MEIAGRRKRRRRTAFHPRACVDKGAPRPIKIKRMDMAAEGDAKELTVHRIGYDRFVTLMRWSAGICAVIAFIVILIIAK